MAEAAAADDLDDLHMQMDEIRLESHVLFKNVNCGDFKFVRDKDEREIKVDRNTKSILVKKESKYIDNEMQMYDRIKDVPGIPKVFAVYTCMNDPDEKYKVIQYELLVPYHDYKDGITTHAEMMKYFRDVFASYMSLIKCHVIHNDLKPDNVLFNPRTREYVVSDFDSSIFAPMLKDHLFNINRDFHRFFHLFSADFKETSLWNASLNKSMDAVLQSLDIADFQKKYPTQAFVHFLKKKKEMKNVMTMTVASDMYVDDYLQFIKENIDQFDQSAGHGHGGKNRRTTRRRITSKYSRYIRYSRTNKANKRHRLTKRR